MADEIDRRGPPDPPQIPICAIGASAGGVAALQDLFRRLPADLGLAYVVILHLSPNHPSAMDEILAAATEMPVSLVQDRLSLRQNHVYVIPPNGELVIEGDRVTVRPFSEPRSHRAPIDMFFRSVASARGDGIAVILTGAGSDGALGIRAINAGGGVVMAQEPTEAEFAMMPQNAIATGIVDSSPRSPSSLSGSARWRAARRRCARSIWIGRRTSFAASSVSCGLARATTSPATSARP